MSRGHFVRSWHKEAEMRDAILCKISTLFVRRLKRLLAVAIYLSRNEHNELFRLLSDVDITIGISKYLSLVQLPLFSPVITIKLLCFKISNS